MKTNVIQLICGFLGTLGFSLIFQVRKKLIFWTSLGGLVCWSVYLVLQYFLGGLFVPYMLAAVAGALYAELMARIHKAPVTLFLILSLIPAIPGGSLYYTMSSLVRKDWTEALLYGYNTVQYSLAIAAGISIVWAVGIMAARVQRFRRKEERF